MLNLEKQKSFLVFLSKTALNPQTTVEAPPDETAYPEQIFFIHILQSVLGILGLRNYPWDLNQMVNNH